MPTVMQIKDISTAYFIGIGGIGMSALARYFLSCGIKVYGYDKTASKLTDKLQEKGIDIVFDDDVNAIPQAVDLVVYTPAVPKDLSILAHFKRMGVPIKKRAEVLGMISSSHYTIAVSGTHGKTSVTALISHILHHAGREVLALIGGIARNYNSNAILSKKPDFFVVEADEYDRSFLSLYPDILVVNSVDEDHMEIYGNKESLEGGFLQLASQMKSDGFLLVEGGLQKIFAPFSPETFGENGKWDFSSQTMFLEESSGRDKERSLYWALASNPFMLKGAAMMKNLTVAVAVALKCGLTIEEIAKALSVYRGVERRFDVRVVTEPIVYIDDYAHHPKEIEALVETVRRNFPDRHITGIFQPHLYSRTKDFYLSFAESLSQLDSIILLPIYPAREKPMDGVSSALIYDHIVGAKKMMVSKDELLSVVEQISEGVLLTIGAGDIDRIVAPIEKIILTYA